LKKLLYIIFLFISVAVNCQYSYTSGVNIFSEITDNSYGGEVKIYQSKEIRDLFLKNALISSKSDNIPGYRIRIYSNLGNTARDESLEAVSKFKEHYPEIKVYRKYVSPYYKVYVGDFRTRLEAKLFLNKLRSVFPDSFDLPCSINLPNYQ
jgi:hypothetical protein